MDSTPRHCSFNHAIHLKVLAVTCQSKNTEKEGNFRLDFVFIFCNRYDRRGEEEEEGEVNPTQLLEP